MVLQRKRISSSSVLTWLSVYRDYVVFFIAIGLSVTMMVLREGDKMALARAISIVLLKTEQGALSWTVNLANLQREKRH